MIFHDELFDIELYETHFGRVVESVIQSARDVQGHHAVELVKSQPLSINVVLIAS